MGVLSDAVITKKTCLSVISSQYDPLGIAACYIVNHKVNLKELYKLGVDWNTPLEGNLKNTWVKLISMLVNIGEIKINRCTKPTGAVGRAILIIFFDGSDLAFGFIAYIRWEMEDGSFSVHFVAAKTRIASLFGTNTVRIELSGSVLATRVAVRIVRALVEDPPETVLFLGDSETVLASRERDKGYFGEFFGNRIGEMHDNETRMKNLVNIDDVDQLILAIRIEDLNL